MVFRCLRDPSGSRPASVAGVTPTKPVAIERQCGTGPFDLRAVLSVFAQLRAGIVVPRAYRAGMFPPEAFAVGVTVAEVRPALWDDHPLPAGVVSRPSRIGDLLPVHLMTPEQKAAHLQRVAEAEAVLAAFKAELIVALATDRPASGDRRRGQTGAASGEWAAQLLDADVSEFFPDELALVLNCSRAAATQLWERSTTLLRRLPATWAALADGWLDWARAQAIAAELGWPARESPDDVLAAVEAVVLPQATGLSITRLRALVRGELIKADPAVAHAEGGQTDCANLCCLCRRHHRLKTHARGWHYVMTSDGVLTVTTPTGVTRVSRPPGMRPDDIVLRVTSERRPWSDPDPPPF
jgi:hypothetical protein